MDPASKQENVHGSAVAIGSAGLLILGRSGSGKSSLALELISRGARLVSDDRVILKPADGVLQMSSPEGFSGHIEARGVGLLRLEAAPAMARWCVTLDEVEDARLPEARSMNFAGCVVPLIRKVESPAFPAILYSLMIGGRSEP